MGLAIIPKHFLRTFVMIAPIPILFDLMIQASNLLSSHHPSTSYHYEGMACQVHIRPDSHM